MNENEAISILKNALIENNIEPIDEIMDKYYKYYEYLIEYNKNVNLTAITSFEDVYIKHFVDSIANCKMYKANAKVCDIGTGAGFPGLALKIARPDLEIYLVDSLNKRITFLNDITEALSINKVHCLHYRAEDAQFKNKFLNSFDYVISRAVANMTTLTEYCLPYVKIGGEFIAYKSNNEETELNEATKCINILGGGSINIINVNITAELTRKLICIKKTKNTSSKYPRGQNKPRLSPIK